MSLSLLRRASSGISSLTLVSVLHTSVAAWAQTPAAGSAAPPAAGAPSSPPAAGTASPAAAGATAAPAQPAAAAPADAAAMREQARAAYGAGQEAFTAGQYAAAEAHFARADSLLPAVQAKYWRALSLDKAGDVPGALAAYGVLLGDPKKDDLGAEKLAAATTRQRELAATPADLVVTTTPAGAHVQISGVDLAAPTPVTLRLAPGRHALVVSLPGYEPQRVEITATPGAQLRPTLTLVSQASLGVVAPVAALSAPPTDALPPSGPTPPHSPLPGYVTLGIAGASAVVGTIFGIKALNDEQEFNDNPTAAKADDVERNALIADMAFGVTLTLGITGIVLLLADDPAPAQVGLAAPGPRREVSRLQLSPYVSPRGAGASASLQF